MNQTASINTTTTTTTTAPKKSFFDKVCDFFNQITFARIFRWCLRLAKVISGAIVLTTLAHFVPELRDKIPTLFKITDTILYVFEWAMEQLIK